MTSLPPPMSDEAQESPEVSPVSDESIQPLIERIRHAAHVNVIASRLTHALGFALVLAEILMISLGDKWTSAHQGILLSCLGIMVMLFSGFAIRAMTFKIGDALQRVVQLDDTHYVGSLIEVLAIENSEAKKVARKALIALLPRLTAEDGRQLTPQHRMALHKLVKNPAEWIQTKHFTRRTSEYYRAQYVKRHKEMVLALLKAYEQIGDENDLHIVRKLAEGVGAFGSNDEIRAAAQECLPFLLIHSEQKSTAQTLLRASDQSLANSADLLRPVAPSDNSESDQLLRSSTNRMP